MEPTLTPSSSRSSADTPAAHPTLIRPIARGSAVAAACLWALDALAIGLGIRALDGPLFLVGLGAAAIAVIAIPLGWTRGNGALIRLGAVIGFVVTASLVVTAVQAVVDRIQPPHPGWVYGEINLWALAAVLVAGAAFVRPQSS